MENSLLNKVLFCNYSEIILWTFETKCIRSISYEVLHKYHDILHCYSSDSLHHGFHMNINFIFHYSYLHWVLNIKSLFQAEYFWYYFEFSDKLTTREFEWLPQNCRRAGHVFPRGYSLAVYNSCKQRAQAWAGEKSTWTWYWSLGGRVINAVRANKKSDKVSETIKINSTLRDHKGANI